MRYVEGLREPPNVPMHFGSAVDDGLSAHFRGEDPDLAFLRSWKNKSIGLRSLGQHVPASLTRTALDLMAQVVALGLSGEPQHRITLHWEPWLGVPVIGYADLWCPDTHTVIDWKVTSGKWSQARADREVWQPALYSLA